MAPVITHFPARRRRCERSGRSTSGLMKASMLSPLLSTPPCHGHLSSRLLDDSIFSQACGSHWLNAKGHGVFRAVGRHTGRKQTSDSGSDRGCFPHGYRFLSKNHGVALPSAWCRSQGQVAACGYNRLSQGCSSGFAPSAARSRPRAARQGTSDQKLQLGSCPDRC